MLKINCINLNILTLKKQINNNYLNFMVTG